jgi:tellurite resistance-related uncharacterized protein
MKKEWTRLLVLGGDVKIYNLRWVQNHIKDNPPQFLQKEEITQFQDFIRLNDISTTLSLKGYRAETFCKIFFGYSKKS